MRRIRHLLHFAIALSLSLPLLAQQTPWSGSPIPIPGFVQAENYDRGGEGVAWHDNTAGNAFGPVYRTDDMDVGAIPNNGGYHIGAIDPGEWAEYTVNVATAGSYSMKLRYASAYPYSTTFRVTLDGQDLVGTQSLTSTNDWQVYTVVTYNVTLAAGNNKILRVSFDTGAFNFDSLEFVSTSSCSGPSITKNPISQTLNVGQGFVIKLNGGAVGTPAPALQWYKDGQQVIDDGTFFSGATTAQLTLSNLEQGKHGGNYTMRATNACGVVETTPAAYVQVNCGGNPGLAIENVNRALRNLGDYCWWQEDLQMNFPDHSLAQSNNNGGGGSYNRPVLSAATAYIKGTNPVGMHDWWTKYLKDELGEGATVWYYGGQEIGSHSYQQYNIGSVLAVHYKANAIGDTVVRDLARRWLRATFALQAMAASPNAPTMQFAKNLSRSVPATVVYDGPYIAMAGMRSGWIHWVDADRSGYFAAAIGWPTNNKGLLKSHKDIRAFVQSWSGVYGLSSTEQGELTSLMQFSTLPANFISRFLGTTLHTQVPYHFVGWPNVKATLMEGNTHMTNAPTYGVVFFINERQAHYLYPWEGVFVDNDTLHSTGIQPGWGVLNLPSHYMEASNAPGSSVHPLQTWRLSNLPTGPRNFWLTLSPSAPPALQ